MTCDECPHLVQYADMWGQDEWCGLGQEPANYEMNKREFDVVLLKDALLDAVVEWFEYGEYRGFGQWRNSGKGRFVCSISDPVTI